MTAIDDLFVEIEREDVVSARLVLAAKSEYARLLADNIGNRKAWDDCYKVNCELRADIETWKKYYYDVADAITSGSTSPTDLCNQARQLRAELAQLSAEIKQTRAELKNAQELLKFAMEENAAKDAALEEARGLVVTVSKMEGRFARDPLTHASNIIEDNAEAATAWLEAHPAPQEHIGDADDMPPLVDFLLHPKAGDE